MTEDELKDIEARFIKALTAAAPRWRSESPFTWWECTAMKLLAHVRQQEFRHLAEGMAEMEAYSQANRSIAKHAVETIRGFRDDAAGYKALADQYAARIADELLPEIAQLKREMDLARRMNAEGRKGEEERDAEIAKLKLEIKNWEAATGANDD